MYPLRRHGDLIVQRVSDETLVYDERNDLAHCLNRAAAFVWQRCDGRTTVEEIAEAVNRDLGVTSGDDVVRLALRTLADARLLESSVDGARKNDVSRRELAKRLGLAAAFALPLVSSIVAPTPLMAASCIKRGGVCGESQGQGQGTPCCAGLQCNNNRCV